MKSAAIFFLLAFASVGYSADQPAQKIEFHDEVDKTDVLAIPYDTSEQEEQQEEQTLENLQKYEQAKKAAEAKKVK